MTISWYSISIPLNGSIIFNGYFSVNNTTNVIQHFYYVNNNQYIDILLRDLGENGSDNIFINNNFTNGGVNILSVIPYINNTYNNPYKLNLWRYSLENNNNTISYMMRNTSPSTWSYSPINFNFIFTSISGLPPLSQPFSMRSLFSNNSQVYYKPHSLSTVGNGVRNYRHIKRRT
jgi:hypothetical protein